MKDFSLFTYKDAAGLFDADRRPDTAKRARRFHDGDPWQEGWGYIGQKPPVEMTGRDLIIADLREGFVSENVIFEVTDSHVGGALGTEPMWDFAQGEKRLRRDKADTFNLGETLTAHWDERQTLQIFTDAAAGLVLEGASVLRLYFPNGLLKDNVIPNVPDIADALTYLYSEVQTADVAGVFTNPETKKKIGVYLFEEGEATKVRKADICYLNEEGKTVLRRLTDGKEESEDFGPYDLGGHLFIHELKRPALITAAILSAQKAVNLAHTMMMRNVNLAGNRTRDVVNAQPPKKKEPATTEAAKRAQAREAGAYKSTPGYVNWLFGLPIYNEQGTKIIGYTNPNVSVTEPVDVTTFRDTRDHFYAVILGQSFMRHVLISGDATASGRSREQARKEYERSLTKTAVVLNAAGRWQLEVELRMAAELSGKTAEVRDLRAVFECNVEKVPVSAEERQENRADVDAGLMAPETAMRRNGVEDTGKEVQKVKEYQEEKAKRARQFTQPPNPPVEDKTGQGAIG
jgi:hypothetical protein